MSKFKNVFLAIRMLNNIIKKGLKCLIEEECNENKILIARGETHGGEWVGMRVNWCGRTRWSDDPNLSFWSAFCVSQIKEKGVGKSNNLA